VVGTGIKINQLFLGMETEFWVTVLSSGTCVQEIVHYVSESVDLERALGNTLT
jgi:hypothetical protein